MADSDYKNYDISSIVGHKKQLEFLNAIFAGNRMPSGLLFFGQKNIGKKFTAVVFAASVLCSDYKAFSGKNDDRLLNFCGKCPSCVSLLNGASQNFMTVEPSGSAIKIESIHKINSFLSLTSAYPGYRFIIIDEASSMNASAANALLKMLEEPVGKTIFILVTSNPGILLPTVVSRCLLLGFSPVPDEFLLNVFKTEFPDIKTETLELYAKLSRGSYSGFMGLIEGGYLEKRNFLIRTIFKELFMEYQNKNIYKNFYEISAKFNLFEKEAATARRKEKNLNSNENSASKAEENYDKGYVFELILFILRDIYIYKVSKNEKLLYNEDIADEIKEFALDSALSSKDIGHMIELTVEYLEKINSYNLNKSIAADSYFSNLLSL